MTHEQLIESLQAQVQPIQAQDLMAEAGRKALLNDLIKMLSHEDGSRAGEDPEEVHDMRVAIRRMRSTLRLLANYYKPKTIDPFLSEMRKIARALGEVRDLDVMLAEVKNYQATLAAEAQAAFQPVIALLETQQAEARKDLLRLLDKGSYRRFVKEFSAFLSKPGKGSRPVDLEDIHPSQVRHLLPTLIYEHLAAVRAYDTALDNADVPTLHALRIEFKRLRYVVSIFSEVLGSSASDFITELKGIQDHLGKIADIRAAKDRLNDVAGQFDSQAQAEAIAAIQEYVTALDQQQDGLRASFDEVWKHFNTKTVQRQLANAISAL